MSGQGGTAWVKAQLSVNPHWRNRHGRTFGGDNWRGRLSVPPEGRGHPVVRRLFAELNAQRTTVSEIESRAGVKAETVRAWAGEGKRPLLDNITAVLNVLDLDLYVGPKGLSSLEVQRAFGQAARAKETPPDEPAGRVATRKGD